MMNFPDIAVQALKTGERQLLLLTGDGGLGKTSALLTIWKRLLDAPRAGETTLVPLYIPLAACPGEGEHRLLRYLYEKLPAVVSPHRQADYLSNLFKLLDCSDSPFHYVFLLDGANEYSDLPALLREVRQLERCRRVSLILSGRDGALRLPGWTHYRLQPLDPSAVSALLPEADRTPALAELLCSPFYLSRYLRLARSGSPAPDRPLTRFSLLERFFSWSLAKLPAPGPDPETALNQLAPQAFSLACARRLTFRSDELGSDLLCRQLLRPLGLIRELGRPGSGRWLFRHELERDYLAAVCLSLAYSCARMDRDGLDDLFRLLSQPIPDDVLRLFADSLREEAAGPEPALRRLNTAAGCGDRKDEASLQRNLVRLLTELGPCLFGFDFSGRDLRRASFAPFDRLLNCSFRGAFFSPETLPFSSDCSYAELLLQRGSLLFPRHQLLVSFHSSRLRALDCRTGETRFISDALPAPRQLLAVDADRLLLLRTTAASLHCLLLRVDTWEAEPLCADRLPSCFHTSSPCREDGGGLLLSGSGRIRAAACGTRLFLYDRRDPDTLHVLDVDRGYLGTIPALFQPQRDLLFADGDAPLAPRETGLPLCAPGVRGLSALDTEHGSPSLVLLPRPRFLAEKLAARMGCPSGNPPGWYALLLAELGRPPHEALPRLQTALYLPETGRNLVCLEEDEGLCLALADPASDRLAPLPQTPEGMTRCLRDGPCLLLFSARTVWLADLRTLEFTQLDHCAPETLRGRCTITAAPDQNRLYLQTDAGIRCLDTLRGDLLWKTDAPRLTRFLPLHLQTASGSQSETFAGLVQKSDGSACLLTKDRDAAALCLRPLSSLRRWGSFARDLCSLLPMACDLDEGLVYRIVPGERPRLELLSSQRQASGLYAYCLYRLQATGAAPEHTTVSLPGSGYLAADFVGEELWLLSCTRLDRFSPDGALLSSYRLKNPLILSPGHAPENQVVMCRVSGRPGVFLLDQLPQGKPVLKYLLLDPRTQDFLEGRFDYGSLCPALSDLDTLTAGPRGTLLLSSGQPTLALRLRADGSGLSITADFVPDLPFRPERNDVSSDGRSLFFLSGEPDCFCEYEPETGHSRTWSLLCRDVTGSNFSDVRGLTRQERACLAQYGAASAAESGGLS